LTLAIYLCMHDFWNAYDGGSQPHETQNFNMNMANFAGLLIVAAQGAPRASLDALASRR
jgi:uncharacterized membrane protein YphA (DoxX/SURF4 family)